MTGFLITKLLGRLKVSHGDGSIEFELRNPKEIEKRGAKVLVKIEGLGTIPRFEDGMVIRLNLDQGSNVRFTTEEEDAQIPHARRGDLS